MFKPFAQKLLDRSRVLYRDLLEDTLQYARLAYNQTESQFTPSSAWGQIIIVINRLVQLMLYQIEDALTEMDINTAVRAQSIRDRAALTGYNPQRAVSARGTGWIRVKGNSNRVSGQLKIWNLTRLQCSNGLEYFIWLNRDWITINPLRTEPTGISIVQGVLQETTWSATGESMQSYVVQPGPNQFVDNWFLQVKVNGQLWEPVHSLYDASYDSLTYITKTFEGGGAQIIFGNGAFGAIPAPGSTISAVWLLTSGPSGNVMQEDSHTFTFLEGGQDDSGTVVELNSVLEVQTTSSILFGTPPESIESIRELAPMQSKNFVIANASALEVWLKKFNYFSSVEITAAPDIILSSGVAIPSKTMIANLLVDPLLKKPKALNYFTMPLASFELSQSEIKNISTALEQSGQLSIGMGVQFQQPTLVKYSIAGTIRARAGADTVQLYQEIASRISAFLLITNKRWIAKSDIITIIELIPDVVSSMIYFVCEPVETELKTLLSPYYGTSKLLQITDFPSDWTTLTESRQFDFLMNYPKFREFWFQWFDEYGNIQTSEGINPIIRGGYSDRYGNWIQDAVGFGASSIINLKFYE
jgi:hypothetical protein